jgi:hypothetical protein
MQQTTNYFSPHLCVHTVGGEQRDAWRFEDIRDPQERRCFAEQSLALRRWGRASVMSVMMRVLILGHV